MRPDDRGGFPIFGMQSVDPAVAFDFLRGLTGEGAPAGNVFNDIPLSVGGPYQLCCRSNQRVIAYLAANASCVPRKHNRPVQFSASLTSFHWPTRHSEVSLAT